MVVTRAWVETGVLEPPALSAEAEPVPEAVAVAAAEDRTLAPEADDETEEPALDTALETASLWSQSRTSAGERAITHSGSTSCRRR